MARPEVTRRGPGVSTALNPEGDAYTIDEFCRRHRISTAFYYKLKAQGCSPDELRLGARVLITRESAARWREAQTTAAAVRRDTQRSERA